MIFQADDSTDGPQPFDGLADGTGDFFGEMRTMLENAGAGIVEHGPEWLIGLGVVIITYFVLHALRAVVAGVVRSKNLPANSFRNVFADLVAGTQSALILIGAAALVAPFVFPLSDDGLVYVRKAFVIVAIIQLALWARVVAHAFLTRAAENSTSDASTLQNAMAVLTVLLNVVIVAIALMTILQNVGVNVTALVAGLGVGGIAIALAAQNIFQDLFASLSIIFDKPFARGDFIKYGADPEAMGFVQKVGLKTTRIKSLSGEELIIGNSQLLQQELRNFRRMSERRVMFQVGVTYQTPHGQLERIPGYLRAIVESMEKVRFDRAHLRTFADSSINFEIVYYVLSREMIDFMDVNQRILLAIHRKFEEEGIDFAYPTRTLWLEGGEAAAPQAVNPGASLIGRMHRD